MTITTKFMTANEIIKEHKQRIESLKKELKRCKDKMYQSLLENLLDKLDYCKSQNTFADIRYAAKEQENIYDDIMHKVSVIQKVCSDCDVLFVTVNCCDGRQIKVPQMIKPDDILNYKPKINTLRKQLSQLSNACGFISFEIKYDARINAFLPHYHIIILGAKENDVKKLFSNLYPQKYSFRIDLNNYKIEKTINPLIKYVSQTLKIVDIKNIKSLQDTYISDVDDLKNVASYICKFKTYQTHYYQQGLKIKVYKDTPYCRPYTHIHNLHLLFLDKLNYGEHFTIFHKDLMTKLITKFDEGLDKNNLKQPYPLQQLSKNTFEFGEHNTYTKPLKTNKSVLKLFGYADFKNPAQKEIIDYMHKHKSCLIIQPTSFGKSFCFQAVALKMFGLCVVIEPTKSLMFNQCKSLNKICKGLAVTINSQNTKKHSRYLKKLRQKKYKFLYISPEMLRNHEILEILKQLNVSLIVVDEAHCIDFWGGDFRPNYENLGNILINFPDAKFMAVTATADEITQQRIKDVCYIPDLKTFIGDLNRKNINYEIIKKEGDGIEQLLQLLSPYLINNVPTAPIIIYCNHIDYVTAVHTALKDFGIDSLVYTGKIKKGKKVLNKFLKHNKIVVATNAFGMGIDKPNVRLVIHFEVPQNLEFYYQESGRAGRDGKKSQSVILYSDDDIKLTRREFCKKDKQKEKFDKVKKYIQLSALKRRKWLLKSIC